MKIDNITTTFDGAGKLAITSRVEGFTFTHGPKCALYTRLNDKDFNWETGCDCFLSRVDITAVNGVPVGTYRRPWWKPRWSLFSFTAGVVVSSLWDWLVRW